MFRFFRYQTPHNPIASSSQSRSKKFVYSGFLQLFFCLFYLIGTLSIDLYYWPLTFENVVAPKGAVFVTSETSLVKALVKFKRQQLPLTAHCAHKRHVTPEAFPADLL